MNSNFTPVLFLIFNRPSNTKQVFEVIRSQKPKHLFIAADGPRNNNEQDKELCEQTRVICRNVDWNCDVRTLFRDQNLGCKIAVSEAITWFFNHVEEGIILEDDCLPDVSFFSFCTELLEKYRTDTRVMSVSGSNLLGKPWKCESQSYHWGHGGIWGWATWKRAWDLYDITMIDWCSDEKKSLIKDAINTNDWFRHYYDMFEATYNGSLDTWDVQWFYCILINNGLAVNPCVNLIKNIGFGNGTHTNSTDNFVATLEAHTIKLPLKHPIKMMADVEYLKAVFTAINKPVRSSLLRKIVRTVKTSFNKLQNL